MVIYHTNLYFIAHSNTAHVTNTDSRMTCSKRLFLLNLVHLQGFPVDPRTFTEFDIMIVHGRRFVVSDYEPESEAEDMANPVQLPFDL